MICVTLLAALGLAVAAPTPARTDTASHESTRLDASKFASSGFNASAIEDLATLPTLPGVEDFMKTGYNALNGDPDRSLPSSSVFDFEYTGTYSFGSATFAIPERLVTPQGTPTCAADSTTYSDIYTTFESSLRSQAKSFQGGYEQESDWSLSVPIKSAELEGKTTFRNALQFGSSSASTSYQSKYEQGFTQGFSAEVKASAFDARLSLSAVTEDDFNQHFVDFVKALGDAPSLHAALDFFDEFGTHVVDRMRIGGYQRHSALFTSEESQETVYQYKQRSTSSGFSILNIGFGSDRQEMTEGIEVTEEGTTYYRSSLLVVGGNSNADSAGAYCDSIHNLALEGNGVATVLGRRMTPIYELVTKVNGVSNATRDKLEEHLTFIADPHDKNDEPVRCKWDSDAVCTWDNVQRKHNCDSACVCLVDREGAGDYHVEDPCGKRVRYGASYNMATQDQAGPFWLTGAREWQGNLNIGDRAYTQNIYFEAPALVGDGYCDERRESTKLGGFTFTSCAERCVTKSWCHSFMFQDDSTGYCILSDSVDCASRTTNRFPWKSYKKGNPWSGTADSYKWIIRSQPGNGDLSYEDPRASEGSCVKYGDRVYLQVMSAERRWLSGGSSSGGGSTDRRVRVYDMLARGEGNPQRGDPHYQWTVRSSPPPLCWEAAPAGSSWCGLSHPGQADYTLESGAAYGDNWRRTSNGWRFCGLTLEACKAACIGMGGCRELNVVSSNGCCFPARSVCDGDERPDDTKLVASTCTEAPPLVDPRQGQCVSLNDKVYLQVNSLGDMGEYYWLMGETSGGDMNVYNVDMNVYWDNPNLLRRWTITRAIL